MDLLAIRHPNAARDDALSWIGKAIRAKAKKPYPDGTILLVRAEADAILRPKEWYEIASEVCKTATETSFAATFIVQTSQGYVLQVA